MKPKTNLVIMANSLWTRYLIKKIYPLPSIILPSFVLIRSNFDGNAPTYVQCLSASLITEDRLLFPLLALSKSNWGGYN